MSGCVKKKSGLNKSQRTRKDKLTSYNDLGDEEKGKRKERRIQVQKNTLTFDLSPEENMIGCTLCKRQGSMYC